MVPPLPRQQPSPAQHVTGLPTVPPHAAGLSAGHLQLPPEQLAPGGHAAPQRPQFAGSLWTSMQAPPQRASPAGQRQAPSEQIWPGRQGFPQPPQFASSVRGSTHAVGSTAGHSMVPVGHRQSPPTQISFARRHAAPQALQFAGSVRRSVQTSPQSVNGGRHWHVDAKQVSFARVQTFPHSPQFCRSEVRSAQRGFDVSQSVSSPHRQSPPAHVPGPHEIPHPPQLEGSVWYDAGSTQSPLHLAWPDGQSESSEESQAAHRARSAAAARATIVRTGRVIAPMIRRPRAGREEDERACPAAERGGPPR